MKLVKNIYGNHEIKLPFVHISDLHIPLLQISFGRIIETIKDCNPEFIIITGDLALRGNQKGIEDFFYLLTKEVLCPIYITLGNHDNDIFLDKSIKKKAYISNFEEIFPSVKILENDYVLYKNEDRSILIGGLADFQDEEAYKDESIIGLLDKWEKSAKEKEASFIVASHNPDILTALDEKKADLFLFGHTHGGQVYLPFNLESRLLRKDKMQRKGYIYGRYIYKDNEIYITSGLGTSFLPIRYKSEAEICLNYL